MMTTTAAVAPSTSHRERIKGVSYFLILAVGIVLGSVGTVIYLDDKVTVYDFADSPDFPYRCVVVEEIRRPATACPWYTIAIQEKESSTAPSGLRPIAGEICTFSNDSSRIGRVEFHWEGKQVTVTFPSSSRRGRMVGTVTDHGQEWAWEHSSPTTSSAR